MPVADVRPSPLPVKARTGNPVSVILNWPAGYLTGKTWTASFGATAVTPAIVSDAMTLSLTGAQTTALGNGRHRITVTETTGDDAVRIYGQLELGTSTTDSPDTTITVTTVDSVSVAVTVVSATLAGAYLTQEEVDDRVAALLTAGTNITLTYNDAAGTLTIEASGGGGGGLTQEQAEDIVAALIDDNSDLDWTYDDASASLVAVIKPSAVTNAMLAGSIALSKLATDPLARANHTGSQAISTVTGLQTALDAKAADADVVHDTGAESIAGVKTFSSDPIIPDEAYDATAWNGVLEPPTKNAVRDALVALDGTFQPLDSDLTAIAALTTTAFGRAFLELANAAAGRTALGLVLGTDIYSKAAVDSGFQPLDSDLTALAALTTTAYGRSLLEAANAGAARTLLGLSANGSSLVTAADYAAMKALLDLEIGVDVQAYDADLTTWAGLTPSANAQSLVTAANYAAMKTLLAIAISDVSGLQAALDAKAALSGATFTGAVREAVVALTDGANIATDASLGNVFKVTLGGNRTMDNPTNPVAGQKIIYRLVQDATGSRTITWGSAFRFSTDVPSPTLTTTAAKADYIGFIYNSDASKWDCLATSRGY